MMKRKWIFLGGLTALASGCLSILGGGIDFNGMTGGSGGATTTSTQSSSGTTSTSTSSMSTSSGTTTTTTTGTGARVGTAACVMRGRARAP